MNIQLDRNELVTICKGLAGLAYTCENMMNFCEKQHDKSAVAEWEITLNEAKSTRSKIELALQGKEN